MNVKETKREEIANFEQFCSKRNEKPNTLIKAGNNVMQSVANSSKTVNDFSFRDNDNLNQYHKLRQRNYSYFTSFKKSFDITKKNDTNKKLTNNFMVKINSTQVINLNEAESHAQDRRPKSSFKSLNCFDKKRNTVKFMQRINDSIEYDDSQAISILNYEAEIISELQNKTVYEMLQPNNTTTLLHREGIDEDNEDIDSILKKYFTNAVKTNVYQQNDSKKKKKYKIVTNNNKNKRLCFNMEFTQMAKAKAKTENNFIVYTQKSGSIYGFSAHSYINSQQRNEDKLGININFKTHNDSKIDFYGIYDGHNGANVSELLYKKLHTEIYSNESFPMDPITSIIKSFHKIEAAFIDGNSSLPASDIDMSGSCALLLLIVDDSFYFANLGDSRAMLSLNEGVSIFSLTLDHKPHLSNEMKRIHYAGGKIEGKYHSHNEMKSKIYPGGLSVSRSIGDIPSKLPKYGGKADVISPIPDIFVVKPKPDIDFILLATSSVFEKLSNKQITLIVFETLLSSVINNETYKDYLSNVIINIMQRAIHCNAKDNMSIVFLVMENTKQLFDRKDQNRIREAIEKIKLTSLDGLNLYNDFSMENVFTGNWVNRRTILGVTDTSINLKSKSTLLTLTGVNCDSRILSTVEAKREKETKSTKRRLLSCCGLFS